MMSLAAFFDRSLHSLLEGPSRRRSVEDLVKRADRARDCRDWVQAARDYTSAVASDAGRRDLQVQLGHALKELGDLDGAEGLYREFLRANPDDADIHLQIGHLFNKRGDLESALTFYEQAKALAPDDVDMALHARNARSSLGRIETIRKREAAFELVAARQWKTARLLLQSLITIDHEEDLIGILANVTKETGRLDEAEALYDCYLGYATKSGNQALIADCHIQLGHLHKINAHYSIGLTHWLRAREIQRADGSYELDGSEIEREIRFCLREIYPCFVFQG
jgi:tetratricopeptide (TPR) repeat protein